jgi:hypothetical protein
VVEEEADQLTHHDQKGFEVGFSLFAQQQSVMHMFFILQLYMSISRN